MVNMITQPHEASPRAPLLPAVIVVLLAVVALVVNLVSLTALALGHVATPGGDLGLFDVANFLALGGGLALVVLTVAVSVVVRGSTKAYWIALGTAAGLVVLLIIASQIIGRAGAGML